MIELYYYRFRLEYDNSIGNSAVTAGAARHSFGKFNAETERLNEEERARRNTTKAKIDNKTVSDKEMAGFLQKRPRE